jgi:uncharacterized phage protein (TIGR02218 family)
MADVKVTQLSVLVLADQVNCVTKGAQCWTITRTDGTVLGFTDHDIAVPFRGVSHVPCKSLAATAAQTSTVSGQTGSQEIRGLLSSAGVSAADLYNGIYDGALVESWMVPWSSPNNEIPFAIFRGVLGVNGHDVNEFSIEVLTDTAKLQQAALLETYTAACRYRFGNENDPRCPVILADQAVTGSVTSEVIPTAPTNAARRVFTDSTRVEADGFFNLGKVTWTSGDNAGAVSEVKEFIAGVFTLWTATLHPISAGDEYAATPGCDKTESSHLLYNADLIDFGGKSFVPGNDSIAEAPDAKES